MPVNLKMTIADAKAIETLRSVVGESSSIYEQTVIQSTTIRPARLERLACLGRLLLDYDGSGNGRRITLLTK